MSWRRSLRARVPRSLAIALDRFRRELPIRCRDCVPDLFDRFGWGTRSAPLPPAALRASVGRTSSREEYLEAGAVAALEIVAAFLRNSDRSRAYPVWLDFGCGPGRIARHVRDAGVSSEIVGVDPNAAAIEWCARHVEGRFLAIGGAPPLPLPDASLDVIFAASVFTHFAEDEQRGWLAELRRVLRPEGLLIASTHAPTVAVLRPEMDDERQHELAERGFAFLAGSGAFNDRTAFHTRRYLEAEWGRVLEPLAFAPASLFRFQDLSVWRKRSPGAPAAGGRLTSVSPPAAGWCGAR